MLRERGSKQPLLVLLKIGETIGIPVDIQNATMEMVDAEISKLSVEDVVRQSRRISNCLSELT